MKEGLGTGDAVQAEYSREFLEEEQWSQQPLTLIFEGNITAKSENESSLAESAELYASYDPHFVRVITPATPEMPLAVVESNDITSRLYRAMDEIAQSEQRSNRNWPGNVRCTV